VTRAIAPGSALATVPPGQACRCHQYPPRVASIRRASPASRSTGLMFEAVFRALRLSPGVPSEDDSRAPARDAIPDDTRHTILIPLHRPYRIQIAFTQTRLRGQQQPPIHVTARVEHQERSSLSNWPQPDRIINDS
jgi:hypothetical protein